MRRIIVSGASGFLGSNILRLASEKSIQTVAISTRDIQLPGCTVIQTEEYLTHGMPCSDDDVFINCLFPTNADGLKMAAGLEKVFRIISRAREDGVGAFVNISSQSVYASKRKAPATEKDELCLETPYAVGKYSSEAFTNQVFAGIPHTNIRMASLLGVGYDQRIVNRMADQAIRGECLKVVGGMQRYGFLDVRDAASGLIKLAESNPRGWKDTYNLGRNESFSLIDVADCIVKKMRKITGNEVAYTVTEGVDERNSSLDASLFMQDVGWSPELTFSDTVSDIITDKLGKAEKV